MELKEALVIVLAFLFPLAIYSLALALVNRRPGPVMVSGPVDFLGVLLALSGFLLVGGPAILSNLMTTLHNPISEEQPDRPFLWFLGRRGTGQLNEGQAGGNPVQVLLLVLLAIYFVALVVCCVLLVLRRRRQTSIYNMDTEAFGGVLGEVLDDLGHTWGRAGNRIYLGPAHSTADQPKEANPRTPLDPETNTALEVDVFPVMRHVTLRWGKVAPALREEIEGELARSLQRYPTRYNPVGNWFMSATASLFLVMLAVLLLLLLMRLLYRN